MNWNNLVSSTANRLSEMQKISIELKSEIPQFSIEFANNIERFLFSTLDQKHYQYNHPFHNEKNKLFLSFEIFPCPHQEMIKTLDSIEGGDANLGYTKKTEFRRLFGGVTDKDMDKQWVKTWLMLFCQLTEIELKSRFANVNDIVEFSVRTDECAENSYPLIITLKTSICQKAPSPASVVFQTLSTKEITNDFMKSRQHDETVSIGTTDPKDPNEIEIENKTVLGFFTSNKWF